MSEDVSNREILEAINALTAKIESKMVTKDYLDRKLWNLKGDLIVMIKREVESHELDFHVAQ